MSRNSFWVSWMKQLRQRQEVRGLRTEMLFQLSVGTYLLTVVVIFWQKPVWASLLLDGAIDIEVGFWQQRRRAVLGFPIG